MKKLLFIALVALAALPAAPSPAAEPAYNVLLTGGSERNSFSIRVSADGRSYLLDSAYAPLEAPPGVCMPREDGTLGLSCDATRVASFEVNVGAGDDVVNVSPKVPVPVTLRGGPGNDRLRGGAAADKLIGGPGDDLLLGNAGDDVLYGGPGDDSLYGHAGADRLFGGPGDDLLRGGSGENALFGGSGRNDLR